MCETKTSGFHIQRESTSKKAPPDEPPLPPNPAVLLAFGMSAVPIPRNFMLLDEVEKAEKGGAVPQAHQGFISHGLTDWEKPAVEFDNMMMDRWHATIIGPQNVSASRIKKTGADTRRGGSVSPRPFIGIKGADDQTVGPGHKTISCPR